MLPLSSPSASENRSAAHGGMTDFMIKGALLPFGCTVSIEIDVIGIVLVGRNSAMDAVRQVNNTHKVINAFNESQRLSSLNFSNIATTS